MVPETQFVEGPSIEPDASYNIHSSAPYPPISKLTSQLLQQILFLAVVDDNGSPACEFSAGRRESIHALPLACVNRQWREALLESQRIWLKPVAKAHSYSIPLDATVPYEASPWAARVALGHLPQLKKFHLAISTNEVWIAAEHLLQQPAPLLETFSLSISSGLDRKKRRSCYIKNIFCGCAPRLRQLEVHNCQFDLTPKTYFNLTALVLEDIQFMPISQLFDVLRNMSHLEKLHMTRMAENVVSPDFHSPLNIPDPPVHMPNLKELAVIAPISLCASIVTKLVLQKSCSIKLGCRNAHNGRDLWNILSRVRETIAAHWGYDADLTGQQSLDIGNAHVNFIAQRQELDEVGHHSVIDLGLFWALGSSDIDLLHVFLPEVLNTFQKCASPETLTLSADANVSPTIQIYLYQWLRKLDDVQAIKFVGDDAFALYAPLLRPDKPLRFAQKHALLPYLTDLIFDGVNFAAPRRQLWRRLLKIMASRKSPKFNSPILMLDFVHCSGNLDQNIPGRFGAAVRIDGEDISEDEDEDGEDSDYTIQGRSDSE